jgi:hypothetical protein
MADLQELQAEILEEAGLEADEALDLPGRITKLSWEGAPAWEIGKNVPGNDNLQVFGIFATSSEEERVAHVEYVVGDIRVYAMPKQSLPGDSFRRMTINRASPAIAHESLTRTSFVTEVSRELLELSSLEEASLGEECPSCENPCKPDAVFCDQCGEKLPEEEEAEEIPENETDRAPETEAQPPVALVPPTPPVG